MLINDTKARLEENFKQLKELILSNEEIQIMCDGNITHTQTWYFRRGILEKITFPNPTNGGTKVT